MFQVTKLSLTPPSVKVSIQLLTDIEAFIFNELPALLKVEEELIKKKYIVSIEEPNTEIKVDSIKEYQYQLLPEKTIKVSQGFAVRNFELKSNNSYDVHVYFGKNKLYSEIRINVTEETPTALTETIKSRLLQILNHYKTLNFIFHPPYYITAFILSTLLMLLFLQFRHIYSNWGLTNFFLVILLATAYNIKPYSYFDTRQNNNLEKIVNWSILTILSAFLLFLTKNFLGF